MTGAPTDGPSAPPREPPAPGAGARRRAIGRFHLGAASLLVAAIVGMTNYLAARHYVRWDWTTERLFTLSERTRAELAGLASDVRVYLFLSAGEPNYREVDELLDRYVALSDRVTVERVDPDRDPGRFRALASRFGIATAATEGGVVADVAAVVTSGDRRWTLERSDLVGLDYGSLDGEDGPKVDVKAEQAITGALVQVTTGRPTRLCATEGHGEWALTGAGERTLFALGDMLQKENVELEAVGTRGSDGIPAACDALFVLGPARPFTEEEAARIEAYLRAGRGVLLALEPAIAEDALQPSGLEGMLRRLGVEVDPTLVLEVDQARLLPPPSAAGPFLVGDFGEHPVVEPLARLGGVVVMSVARSLRARPGADPVPLFETSDEAFALRDLARLADATALAAAPGDVTGPITLGYAVEVEAPPPDPDAEAPPRPGRLVVVGDVDWAADELLRAPQFMNADLARALTGYLTEREALVAIAPKQIDAVPLTITEDDLGGFFGIFVRVVVAIPLAFLMLGFSMWWWRRA